MKILFLAALVVAVSSVRLIDKRSYGNDPETNVSPWQVGKLYRYDVESYTHARLPESASAGNAFKARFTVRVTAPGRLQAKLEQPQHAQYNQELEGNDNLPMNIKYQPAQNLDKPFEIKLQGGRVQSLNLPSSVPLAQENLLKGLIGALQVDLSTHRNVHSDHDTFDKRIMRGTFRKMETDVTGDCETLYTVSPVASEWRRELPNFADEEDPIEISKSKNYGHCHHRVDYHYGVPEGVEWTGTAHRTDEEQLIKRATVSRILSGKQGPIYKSEVISTVHVHPHLYGQQKAEVHSHVKLTLVSLEQDSEREWQKPEGNRPIQNLLYALTPKPVNIEDSSSSSHESNENYNAPDQDQEQGQGSPRNRARRSSNQNKIVAINKIVIQGQNRRPIHSGSSSSSESNSLYVNDDVPRNNEPAYAALYMNPQPHGDKKQNPMNAQKLVQEIAQQLQNPNNMPRGDFLSKFNVLVRVIASMSLGQLSQTSRSIEIAKSSNNIVKADMWMIYRDAVTQAGTLPAFQQIKSWIQSQKIQGEEAAQVTSLLPHTLRYPTKDLMTQFFELAMSEEVRQQRYLNTSALIAATKFINMGQVNNDTAHSFYPTHMYGRLSRKHDAFVLEEILPRLQNELEEAVQNGDSHKQQIYIKAIGNLGHRAILEVFAPYLEGRVTVSNYIRTQIVYSLQPLAHQKDSHVRAVLYSILKNTAEPYEVRVAAINNIFMTRPSSSMMQSMAEMTHNDPSIEVRAALKSGIQAAATLKDPRYFDLARTAQAAKDMLTKEEFGVQNSAGKVDENYDSENGNTILSFVAQIGSADNLFPKYISYAQKNKAGGWNKISAAFSSVQNVMDYLNEQLYGNNKDKQNESADPNHKYSAEKVAQMLNIKRYQKEPLGASLELNFMNQERFFAFDQGDLQQVAQDIKAYIEDLEKGVDKHYTKVLNQAQMSVMFPVATGMPFIYKYKEPTVVHIQSKLTTKYNKPSANDYSSSIDKTLHLTYARNIDGSVGFLDTLANQHASAGVLNRFQLYVPVKMQMQMKPGEVQLTLSPLEPEQEHTILHYSSWPYTANQKKDTLSPVSQDPSTKLVTRNEKVVSLDSKYGQQVGVMFQVQGYSYSNDYKNIRNKFKWEHPASSIASALYQKDIGQTHFNLKHLGKPSKNKEIKLTAVYDAYYNQKQEGQFNPTASEVNDVSPNSEDRRKELVKRAVTGINGAKADVVDLSISFNGAQKVEYVATAAIADSPVDEKSQYAIFASKNSPQGNSQINAVGKHKKPEISSFNYQSALEKDLKIPFEFDIRYGQNGNVHINGQSERSKKYSDALKSHPLAKQCASESAQGNRYQEACYQMIIMAHTPDISKAKIMYKDVSPAVRNFAFQWYKFAESLGYWNADVNPFKTLPEGQLEISTEASYLTNSMNFTLHSKYGEVKARDLEIPEVSASAASAYTPFAAHERVNNYYHRQQYQPYCSVDANKVKTYSGRSYDYSLSSSWHVVTQDNAKRPGQSREQYVILAKSAGGRSKQQELYISYQSENGKQLEIQVKPGQRKSKQQEVQVNSNAKKISQGELTTYWDDDEEQPFLQYYTGSDGVLSLNIRQGRLRLMYDGSTTVVLNGQSRNSARGICGQMSGDPRDDYLTPNGLVDRPDHYGASFALDDENSDPKTKQLKEEAKEKAYQQENQYTPILHSDDEWKNAMQASSSSNQDWGSQSIYRSKSYSKQRGQCQLNQQVQYYENQAEICITTRPLNTCNSHCSGEGYKIQAAQVVCRQKLDEQFREYRDQIRQGQNPTVTGVPQNKQYRVPSSCKA
ncbi:vitellogenin-like [Battus philenor]|uniref:vitellogenin-like n=1 Tax=Battus philenor TaxID=42288 RepID=UPI0035CECC93